LKSYFTNVFNLSNLENAFETAKDSIIGGNGIIGDVISGIKSDLSDLNDYVKNTFGININESFLDVFDSVAQAITQPFEQVNFSELTEALDDLAIETDLLIASLNTLGGVNIDAEIPNFTDVQDYFEGIFDNQEQEQTYQPPDDDSSDTNDDGGLDAGGFGDELGGDPAGGSSDDPPSSGGAGGGGGTAGGTIAATGGYVDSTGLATIHEGERIVPDAQVTDRGETQFDISGMSDLLSDMSPSYSFDLPNVSVDNQSPLERIESVVSSDINVSDNISINNDEGEGISQNELERAFSDALSRTSVEVSDEEMRREIQKVRSELRRMRDEMDLDVEFTDTSKWEVTK